jgi:hypothetical protein
MISYPNLIADFESIILEDQAFEPLSQTAMLADVVLQTFHSVVADDEPQLQCAESSAQRDTPVLFNKCSSYFL